MNLQRNSGFFPGGEGPSDGAFDLRAFFEPGTTIARIAPRLEELQCTLPECRIALVSFLNAPRRILGTIASRGVSESAIAELEALFGDESRCRAFVAADGRPVPATGRLSSLVPAMAREDVPPQTRALILVQPVCDQVSSAIAVWRDGGYGRFRDSEIDTIAAFASATILTLQLLSSHDGETLNKISAFLERMDVGFLVATDTRRIVRSNAPARALLTRQDLFADGAEQLRLADGALDQRLERIAADLLSGNDHEAAALPLKTGDRELTRALVMPLRTRDDGLVGAPFFALVIPAPRRHAIEAEQLMALSFTRAEAELTVQLLEGCTVAEYARKRSLAIPTVRAHLKRAMMRVGVHRQADLVRVLLNTFQG